MNSIVLIVKGFIIGTGKIIPGVSGSLLAFALGVYEDAILAITHFFKDIKGNIIYLGKLGLGIICSIILFSNLVIYLLDKYYVYTIMLFVGLICGTMPYILKEVKISRKRNILFIFLALFIVYCINYFKTSTIFIPQNNILNYFYIIFIGFIDAATMIIPGISGTATFIMMGCYDFVLHIFSNPFANIFYFILFALGIFIGIGFISLVISYLLKKHKEPLFLMIIGFSISSIWYLILKILPLLNFGNIITVILLYIIGFILSLTVEKL